MAKRPGEQVSATITVRDSTGAAVDPASPPTCVLRKNSDGTTDVAATVAKGSLPTGQYRATATIPSDWAAGDKWELVSRVTVDDVPDSAVEDAGYLEAAAGQTVDLFTPQAIAQLATRRAFFLSSPLLTDGSYEIVRGQDCAAADGRSLDLPNPQGSWPDLTGAAIYLTAKNDSSRFTVSGSVVTPTGTGQKVRGEPDSAWTQQLAPGRWVLEFEAILPTSSRVLPLGRAPLEVQERARQP